ncbi:hypothetical protein [Nonomuraea sp. SBT364]|uniref:hypothetical protein n=1 Tax=Nonomuraea sp. SBT364 TaxID=1580530 RepID=UPI00066B232F|nr:hypothetical protein [Nonomuraea sp. SBT364]
MRYSADGGLSFPARYERPFSARHPNRPATVAVFDRRTGMGRLLVLDHDISRAIAVGAADPAARVAAEAAAVAAVVERCGGRVITDVSPAGGRHVYALFARPIPWTELYQVACALAARFPTIDKAPMSSPAGQIRVPGSPHKVRDGRLTGWMRLTIPLDEAVVIARQPNSMRVWELLHDELAVELGVYSPTPDSRSRTEAVRVQPAASGWAIEDDDGIPWLPRPRGRRAPRPDLGQRARTGNWSGYDSRSECRLAILNSLAAAGWRYGEVVEEMERGVFGGLTALLEKRSARDRERALRIDWEEAVTSVAAFAKGNPDRNFNTSPSTSSPPLPPDAEVQAEPEAALAAGEGVQTGSLYAVDSKSPEIGPSLLNPWQEILLWRNAVWIAERDPVRRSAWGRAAPAIRMLLRAMAVAARLDQAVTPAFGTRQLARMSGYDHTTVAKHLKLLRQEAYPLIDRIVVGRGKQGDRYQLVVPAIYRAEAVARRWRGGRIETTHHALNLEGACVALTHEVLSSAPTSVAEIARLAVLSRTSTVEALRILAELDLAERTSDGWIRRERSLKEVAIETGAEDDYQATLAEHRAERNAWWATIAAWNLPAATDDDRPARPAKTRPDSPWAGADADQVPWPTDPTDDIEGRAVPSDDDVDLPIDEVPSSEVEAIVLLEQMLGARVITRAWPKRPPRPRPTTGRPWVHRR